MTYFGKSLCLIFDVGGSVKIPERDLIMMRERCPQKRAYLFISHFDKDHICNYKRLMTYIQITRSYFSHLSPRSQIGKKLLDQLKFQNSEIHQIRAGFRLKTGNSQLKCLWPPPGPLGKAENDRSLVFLLLHGHRSFLLTGDLPAKLEKKLDSTQITTLKAGHHGSRFSTSSPFLKRLTPKICVVSAGRFNSYGHPNAETLKRMNDAHCVILRTDRLGDITIDLD